MMLKQQAWIVFWLKLKREYRFVQSRVQHVSAAVLETGEFMMNRFNFGVLVLVASLAVATLPALAVPPGEPLFEVTRLEIGYGPGCSGDIVELKDGTLLFVMHTGLEFWKEGIMARISKDRGRTWSKGFSMVAPATGGRKKQSANWAHPSLLRLPNGEILLSYIVVTQTSYWNASPRVSDGEGLSYSAHNYWRRSADEGKTWTDQYIMTPQPGYNLMHNGKLLVLSTGRIISPVSYKKRDLIIPVADHGGYVSTCFYSDDNGYSWHRSKNDIDMLGVGVEVSEPHVVELKDGRLMMMFRNYSGFVGRSYSDDGGETWSPGELVKELPMPHCTPLTVDRIPSNGDLLLTMPTGPGGRTPLVSLISQDEGKTWTHRRAILDEPDARYGYQVVKFLDDVVLVATSTRQNPIVVRLSVDWFYQGD